MLYLGEEEDRCYDAIVRLSRSTTVGMNFMQVPVCASLFVSI